MIKILTTIEDDGTFNGHVRARLFETATVNAEERAKAERVMAAIMSACEEMTQDPRVQRALILEKNYPL